MSKDIISAMLYDGTVALDLNTRNHRYHVATSCETVTGTTCLAPLSSIPDGVTTACNGVIPKFSLQGWIGRVGPQEVRDKCLEILEATGQFPEISAFLAICAEAESCHERLRDAGGETGSAIHDLIEKHLQGQEYIMPTHGEMLAGFSAFLAWIRQTDIEILEVERLVFSKAYFYAGKTDFIGRRNGHLLVGDFKTGSGLYEEQPYQLAAYALAIEEETGEQIDDGLIIHIDKKTGRFTEYPIPLEGEVKAAWKAAIIHYKNLKWVRKKVEEWKANRIGE